MPTNDGHPERAARRGRRQTIADRDGWCCAPAGVAFVGASSDFDTDVAARLVTADASRAYCEVPRSVQEAGELDAARVDRVLDDRAPMADALRGQVRDAVRARAQCTAGQSRDERIAAVVRRSRQLGITTIRPTHRHDRRPASHGPRSTVPDGRLVVAFRGNARVWSARGLAAPRWIWRSWRWRAGAGCC